MQARASRKKVLALLEIATPVFAELLHSALITWLAVQPALPLQRANPHAAAAVQAVQAAERAASLCKTKQQRVEWMQQHVPGVTEVMVAHVIAQSDISLQRLLIVQRLAWSEPVPHQPSQQLLEVVPLEQDFYWQLYALGRIAACLTPMATVVKALSGDWDISASGGQQRQQPLRHLQAEKFLAVMTMDLMGQLGFVAAIDRVTQALKAMNIPLSNPYEGVEDGQNLLKAVLRLHAPLSTVWLNIALALPPSDRNRAAEAWLLLVEWDAIALVARGDFYRSNIRWQLCHVLSRPDLVAGVEQRRMFTFMVKLLNALGVQRQHLKDAGVSKTFTEELLNLQQQVRQHMRKKAAAAARERQQHRGTDGESHSSRADNDAEDDDKLDDMHSLLEMMYGNLDIKE